MFFSFLLGLLALNATMGVVALLALRLTWGVSIAASVCAALLIVVWSFRLKRGILFFCGVYAMAGGMLASGELREYVTARAAGVLDGVNVRQVPDLPPSGGYRFRDAVLRRDIRGEVRTSHAKSVRGFRESRSYFVAAIVPSDWMAEEPVALWAACGELDSCRKDWARPFNAALRLNSETASLDDYRLAVDQAVHNRGLTSVAQPLLLTWVEDPDKAIQRCRDDAGETVMIWNVVWLITVLFAWSISLFKKRPSNAPHHPLVV